MNVDEAVSVWFHTKVRFSTVQLLSRYLVDYERRHIQTPYLVKLKLLLLLITK